MYSVYNRSIPISFQNTLYCGTESKRNDAEETKQIMASDNHFLIALILLCLLIS